jgi:hypothetical protein
MKLIRISSLLAGMLVFLCQFLFLSLVSAPLLFSQIGPSPTSISTWRVEQVYPLGAVVLRNGMAYQSTIGSNVAYDPAGSPAQWNQLAGSSMGGYNAVNIFGDSLANGTGSSTGEAGGSGAFGYAWQILNAYGNSGCWNYGGSCILKGMSKRFKL